MTIDEMIAVLRAAKEGKVIQFRDKEQQLKWHDCILQSWNFHLYDYRVKPEVLRYKVALMQYQHDTLAIVGCTTEPDRKSMEEHHAFVRWLTDWQEVEV